jgi:hypothetical protein
MRTLTDNETTCPSCGFPKRGTPGNRCWCGHTLNSEEREGVINTLLSAGCSDENDRPVFNGLRDATLLQALDKCKDLTGNARNSDGKPFLPPRIVDILSSERRATLNADPTERGVSPLRGGDANPPDPWSTPTATGMIPPSAAGEGVTYEDHVPSIMRSEDFVDRYVNSVQPNATGITEEVTRPMGAIESILKMADQDESHVY